MNAWTGRRSPVFERLITPLSADRFFAEYYEQTFVHVSERSHDHFSDVFSLKAAEELLWLNEGAMTDYVRFHNAGRDIVPPSDVGPRDIAKWAFDQYRSGTTFIMNGLEDYHLPLTRFVRELAVFFGARVSVAAYGTPRGARAFRVHFDTHDVIIAQVEGAKQYDLYLSAEVPQLPLPRQQLEIEEKTLGPPIAQIGLKPGDVLYIPRGLVHVARTDTSHSLHLTFSLHPPKIADYFQAAIELVSEAVPSLRGSAIDVFGEAKLDELITSITATLGVQLAIKKVRTRLSQRFVAGLRPLPFHRLQDANDTGANLAENDWLERTAGTACAVYKDDAGAKIEFPGLGVVGTRRSACLLMPESVLPALHFIEAQTEPFQISSIPGPLSANSKVILARRLIQEGLLRPSTSRDTLPRVSTHVFNTR